MTYFITPNTAEESSEPINCELANKVTVLEMDAAIIEAVKSEALKHISFHDRQSQILLHLFDGKDFYTTNHIFSIRK